ncbi:MAG: aminotransferase class I/II-fold pyridoxal phosphate-dependent enzyme [Lachnospiraceae bacterium]|nr:aminotransferase class I/II-fold pyridoxal phosphate-dependent enzyme [Lachnospiraceae bacterium]
MQHGGEWEKNKIDHDFSININPLGMPGCVKDIFSSAEILTESYPDRECREIKKRTSKKYEMPEEYIFCGNGASECISLLCAALKPERAIIPVPAFSGYERALVPYCPEILYYGLKREDGFRFTGEFINYLKDIKKAALFLCNPGNPTGISMPEETLKETSDICKKNDIRLIMDECFVGFLESSEDKSLKDLIKKEKHIVVIDAFTKLFAIPGLRMGFLFTSDMALMERINLLKPEWSVSSIAQAAALAVTDVSNESCIRDYLNKTGELILKEREYLKNKLEELNFTVYPGEADFLMFTAKGFSMLQDKLAEKHILIRDCSNFKGLEKGDYRIAIKQHEENEILINNIKLEGFYQTVEV